MIDTVRHSTTLENGITVLSEEALYAHRTAVAVSVMAGGIHEPTEKAGLAHLLEHVLFRGTATRPGPSLREAIEDLGGFINGQTFQDRTTYTGTVILENLTDTVALLADMVMNPTLDDDDIELEKQIVEDENCRGCFGCSMNESFFEAAYPDQRMSQPVIGYEDTVKALTREDLAAFHETYYTGGNITVAVCGNVSHDKVVEMVREAFAGVPEGKKSVWPALEYDGGDLQMTTSSSESDVWIGFDFTDLSNDEKRCIAMFADILGGHAQSRLMQELREKRGLVYNVSAEIDIYARRDVLRIFLQGPSAKFGEICDLAAEVILDSATNLSEAELTKAMRRHHIGEIMSLDGLEGRVEDMVTDVSDLGWITDPAERYQGYLALTVKQITTAATKMLSKQPTIIMSAPVRNAPKLGKLRQKLDPTQKSGGFLQMFKRAG
ncbi:pitrilysin family protein [Parasphingorhabdus sp.]|uniref:M16 family metallopeptidase n=1 Tax=Parasphingorhabdus sp. TaxID=2709688 RepID=UPI0032995D25